MTEHFKVEILDPARLIKENNLKEITNPVFFIRDGVPSPDGLLSNEIFGITKDQRANTFAYIDLVEWFLDPFIYKMWNRMDKRISELVHGTKYFSIDDNGYLVEDENGETGIDFLRKNIDKIKIKRTSSNKRDAKIELIEQNKKKMFINKFIVIPAYYRDINTEGGYVGVGEINQLYNSLLIAVRSLKETAEYGLNLSEASRGRVQQILLQIYNWFTKEPNLSKKYGIIRQSVMSKTVDYGSRLVIVTPQLKCEKMEDMVVNLEYTGLPLASACVNFLPFILFWLRNFFENEFGGTGIYNYMDKNGNVKQVHVKDPLIEFSDERLKKEIKRFVHGFSNRFIPIEIPNEEGVPLRMVFKGYDKPEDIKNTSARTTPLTERDLTWCDLFYMAACDVTKDRHIVITRYPMDSAYNQFATKVKIISTGETEPMYYNSNFYPNYPKIRQEDILSNTSNKFIDTLNISNLYLEAIGGDYKMVTL